MLLSEAKDCYLHCGVCISHCKYTNNEFALSPFTYRKCAFLMVGTQSNVALSDCVQAPRGTPHPSHSCDSDVSGRSGIAETWVQTTLKHSKESIMKDAKPMYIFTGTCDSSVPPYYHHR